MILTTYAANKTSSHAKCKYPGSCLTDVIFFGFYEGMPNWDETEHTSSMVCSANEKKHSKEKEELSPVSAVTS